ncbi:MAG TPA: protein kinase, partial [Gemmatimonadaceae bacterium]|nr:protein kinase [Gemmatimonadaceae bacterium]
HRDLKPENILLHEDQPLVADFGIALAVSNAGGNRITQTGLSLGTPQYMSPEQATGDRAIDGRTDIYSLGAVLYEMLTGDPPHTGSTAQAIIAKVITDRPRPVRLSRDTVPPQVEAAIDCALAKLPADRFATAQDFVDTLRGTRPVVLPRGLLTPASATTDPTLRASRQKRLLRTAALLTAGAVLGSGGVAFWPRSAAGPKPARFVLAVNDSARFRNPPALTTALSPDGSRIVYSGGLENNVRLFVRELDELEAKPISGTENGNFPIFSPDGRNVLFNKNGQILRVGIEGGSPVAVSDSGSGYFWGDGGVVLIWVTGSSTLYQTTSTGGPFRRIAGADRAHGISAMGFPFVLPGGKVALVTLYKGTVSGPTAYLGAVRLSTGEVIDLDLPGANPRYVGGYVFVSRPNGSIYAAPFNARRLRITGPAISVLENVTVRGGVAAEFGVAQNGTMVYRTGFMVRQLVSVDLQGKETPVLPELREYSAPRFSPDGKRVSISISGTSPRPDTWIFDRQSGALTRLTQNGSDRAEWSPDGRTLFMVTQDFGTEHIVGQPWDASGAAKTFLAQRDRQVMELALPRQGRGYLAARVGAPSRDIWIAPVDSPQTLRPFLATNAEEMMPSVSPEGMWLAYVSNESGRPEVYVRPMPGPGGRVQISTDGGLEPMWSPKPGELFYRGSGKVILARVNIHEAAPSVTRQVLFDDIYVPSPVHAMYDVSPDGSRLLFTKSAGGDSKTIVVLNWLTEVRERFARARP